MGLSTSRAADLVLHEMIWDAAFARRVYASVPVSVFPALGAAQGAAVFDHDRAHPDSPAEGVSRALGVSQTVHAHVVELAGLRRERERWRITGRPNPAPLDPYRDPALTVDPSLRGWDDPLLLALSARLVREGELARLISLDGADATPRSAASALRLLTAVAGGHDLEASRTRRAQLRSVAPLSSRSGIDL